MGSLIMTEYVCVCVYVCVLCVLHLQSTGIVFVQCVHVLACIYCLICTESDVRDLGLNK